MIELFFVVLLKGQLYEVMYSFSTCGGGPLYGAVVYSKIRQIMETGFTWQSPLFEKLLLLNGRF
jgi:hypothetical protein